MLHPQKRKFYIIGHNPNTLKEAEGFLKAGANALEPDIRYRKDLADTWYVAHDEIELVGLDNAGLHARSLGVYLDGLRQMIGPAPGGTKPRYNLALINFDIKVPEFDINSFVSFVFDHFSNFPICNGVAILITYASLDRIAFLNAYKQNKDFVGIGIDEEPDPAAVAGGFWSAGQKRFCYADGIVSPGIKWHLPKSIMRARANQTTAQGEGFKLVYMWTLDDASSMRSYLDLGIDATIVDLGKVQKLKDILAEPHFVTRFELAQNGYNPFGAPPMPSYSLTINTRHVNLAGTNVKVRFTLMGSKGVLASDMDGSFLGVLEAGSTDYATLSGLDLGQLKTLSVALLGSSIDSDWLPHSITVESNMNTPPKTFIYGPNQWVKFQKPITLPF
jgi:hypothetical protein